MGTATLNKETHRSSPSPSDAFHSHCSYFRAPVCEKQSRADIPRSLNASFNFQLRSRPGRCPTTGCPQAPPILASPNMKTSAELCPNDASDNGTGPACRQPVVYTWCRVVGEHVFTQRRRPEEAKGRPSVGGDATFPLSSSLRLYLERSDLLSCQAINAALQKIAERRG